MRKLWVVGTLALTLALTAPLCNVEAVKAGVTVTTGSAIDISDPLERKLAGFEIKVSNVTDSSVDIDIADVMIAYPNARYTLEYTWGAGNFAAFPTSDNFTLKDLEAGKNVSLTLSLTDANTSQLIGKITKVFQTLTKSAESKNESKNTVGNTSNASLNEKVTNASAAKLEIKDFITIRGSRITIVMNRVPNYGKSFKFQIKDVGRNGSIKEYTSKNNLLKIPYKDSMWKIRYKEVGNGLETDWSKWQYFLTPPEQKANTMISSTLQVSWKATPGAKSYTVFVRKHGSKKWEKVRTTRKLKCDILTCGGKKIKDGVTYEVGITANGRDKHNKFIRSAKAESEVKIYLGY